MATIRRNILASCTLAIASIVGYQTGLNAHPIEHQAHHQELPQQVALPVLPPGPNTMLRAPVTIAEGLEVIISDVIIPPGESLPLHYHPGEEFIYMLEGSVIHIETGKADQLLQAGDTLVIPPYAPHAPKGGPEGGRAIVFRVHIEGEPERILVE
jgi:quercetin dioxygenase-like cupin family protein